VTSNQARNPSAEASRLLGVPSKPWAGRWITDFSGVDQRGQSCGCTTAAAQRGPTSIVAAAASNAVNDNASAKSSTLTSREKDSVQPRHELRLR